MSRPRCCTHRRLPTGCRPARCPQAARQAHPAAGLQADAARNTQHAQLECPSLARTCPPGTPAAAGVGGGRWAGPARSSWPLLGFSPLQTSVTSSQRRAVVLQLSSRGGGPHSGALLAWRAAQVCLFSTAWLCTASLCLMQVRKQLKSRSEKMTKRGNSAELRGAAHQCAVSVPARTASTQCRAWQGGSLGAGRPSVAMDQSNQSGSGSGIQGGVQVHQNFKQVGVAATAKHKAFGSAPPPGRLQFG